jgi:hypothetical protein
MTAHFYDPASGRLLQSTLVTAGSQTIPMPHWSADLLLKVTR